MKKSLTFLILLIGLSSISTGFVWDDQQPVATATPSSYVWDNTTTVPISTPVPVIVATSTPIPILVPISNTTFIIPIEFSTTNIIILIVIILIISVISIELWLRRKT